MTRRDTIILAVLCNLVILACVLATARQLVDRPAMPSSSQPKKGSSVDAAAQETVVEDEPLVFDEIDQLLEEYVADDSTSPEEPAPVAKKSPAKAAVAPKKAKEKGDAYYTVRAGDNPWKIAKKFHISFEKLLQLNHLDEAKARNLKIGQQLKIRDS